MSEPIAHDTGGRPIFVGSVVRLTDDVAHLYDEGKSRSWTVERTLEPGESYKKPESLEPEAQLRWFNSPRTLVIRNPDGVSAFAPALWVTTAQPAVVAPSAPSDLREFALVLFNERNSSAGIRMEKLTVWAIDYVHRTNPPRATEHLPAWARSDATLTQIRDAIIQEVGMMASARTPEMQAAYNAAMIREYGQVLCGSCQCNPDPRGPSACFDCRAIGRQSVEASTWTTFLHDLSIKFGSANIGCQPTPESVREAVDVALDALKTTSRLRKEYQDRAAELEVKYHELKDRVDNAVKSFGGG